MEKANQKIYQNIITKQHKIKVFILVIILSLVSFFYSGLIVIISEPFLFCILIESLNKILLFSLYFIFSNVFLNIFFEDQK